MAWRCRAIPRSRPSCNAPAVACCWPRTSRPRRWRCTSNWPARLSMAMRASTAPGRWTASARASRRWATKRKPRRHWTRPSTCSTRPGRSSAATSSRWACSRTCRWCSSGRSGCTAGWASRARPSTSASAAAPARCWTRWRVAPRSAMARPSRWTRRPCRRCCARMKWWWPTTRCRIGWWRGCCPTRACARRPCRWRSSGPTWPGWWMPTAIR